jgi:hypothetical protein
MKKCLLLLLIAACLATVNAQSGVFKILTAPDQTYYTIGGYSGSPIVITKYLSSGVVDQSYGTGGSVTVGIHPFDALLLSDGKILLAGTTPEYADIHPDRMVVRLNTDGSLDPSFKTIIQSASTLSYNVIRSWTVSNNRIGIIGYSFSLVSQISGYTCTIYDTSGVFVTSISLGPIISPISSYENYYSISFVGDKIIISSQIYIPYQGYIYTTKTYNADGSPYIPGIIFSCPKDTVVATGRGLCSAIINGLDPIISSSGDNSAMSYILSGATTGNGTGAVSGTSFNKGVTTVQYAQTSNPANSCSFTVTVEDREAPEISNLSVSPANIWPPDQKMQTVDVNYFSQDNCGIANIILSVASNELKERGGNPGLENDWSILNNHQVQLRATLGKNPKERVYTISVTATDEAGNQTTRSINISVANEKVNSGEPFTKNKPFVEERPGLGLQVNVLSNPSTGNFTILTNSNSNEKISMRVMNMLGMVIDSKTSLPSKGQLQIGNEYPTGFYIAVFTQGSQKCLVKLLKQQ